MVGPDDADEGGDEPKQLRPPNGLFCFLDGARECGPDCMAFTEEEEGEKSLSHQQRNCLLLVSVNRLSRYVAVGATVLSKEAADRKRTQHSPPPDPRGTKP